MKTSFPIFFCWLLLTLFPEDMPAQTFKRVRLKSEITPGDHYLLVAKKAKDSTTVYVMGQQEKTGTKHKNPPSHLYSQDANERVTIHDANAAIFQLQSEGSAYRFYDGANNAWLAYDKKGNSDVYTGLHGMTADELDANVSFSSLFSFVFDKKRSYIQAKNISEGNFRIQMNQTSNTFRLQSLKTENYGDSLFLYKKEATPATCRQENGDWTFYGDWTAEQLSGIDFSEARRIDFSGMELPSDWETVYGMPREWVWTYVRKGGSGRLPGNWCNVIEVYPVGSSVPGKATTLVLGNDSSVWGTKYAFTAPYGIAWERHVRPDSGWYSFGAPFAIDEVRKGEVTGEAISLEKYRIETVGKEYVYLRDVSDETNWEAHTAYVWKANNSPGPVFFYATTADLTPPEDAPSTETGWHFAEREYPYNEGSAPLYLLNATGSHFTRAQQGSRIAPTRVYLIAETDRNIRFIIEDETGLRQETSAGEIRVYNLQGILKGTLHQGEAIPSEWQPGIYLTPNGKIWKR